MEGRWSSDDDGADRGSEEGRSLGHPEGPILRRRREACGGADAGKGEEAATAETARAWASEQWEDDRETGRGLGGDRWED